MEKIITEKGDKFSVKGYGASGDLIGGKTLKEMDVERNQPTSDEVLIEVLYCGVCHSDIHQVNNDWDNTRYPCVPGHEVIGKIVKLGSDVTDFEEGQTVGVGCMIDSCQTCKPCENGEEQFCMGPHGPTMTYNGYFRDPGFDIKDYVPLLSVRGSVVTVGLLGPYESPLNNMQVAMFGRSVAGSVIGGIAETQEVLDFCAEHNILPEVEMISIDQVNDAFTKVVDEEVRFRYVIDMNAYWG